MSAREAILTFHHKIPEMQKNIGISRVHLADALFENFVGYASKNWDYVTQSGSVTADTLLSGTGRIGVDCGKLRTALEKMLVEDLGLREVSNVDLDSRNHSGHFIAKFDLHCFDSKVRGNVGNLGSATFNLACFFTTHYFLKCGPKYYDACLSTTYNGEQEPIFQKTKIVGTAYKTLPNVRWGGAGRAAIILRSKQQAVPGFGSVWEIIKLDEVKRAFSREELTVIRSTPDLQGLL